VGRVLLRARFLCAPVHCALCTVHCLRLLSVDRVWEAKSGELRADRKRVLWTPLGQFGPQKSGKLRALVFGRAQTTVVMKSSRSLSFSPRGSSVELPIGRRWSAASQLLELSIRQLTSVQCCSSPS